MAALALVVWGGVWCGVTGSWAWLALAVAVAVLAVAVWRTKRRVLLVAALGAMAAGAVGAMWWWGNSGSPLADFARQRAVVAVEAVVAGDPVVWPPSGILQGETVVNVSVRQLLGRGREYSLRQTASLTMGLDGPRLEVGQRIALTARPSWPATGLAPVIRLRALGDVTLIGSPGVVDRALNRLRAGLRGAMVHSPPDQAGLVPGLVVGDVSNLSPALSDAFKVTALTHLTAVSGTNLTLMTVFLVTAARVAGARGWWLRGVTVAGVIGFVALCRGEPSVLRAAAMGLTALAATGVTSAPGRGLRQWGVAVMGVCLIQPALSHSWGFAMSAAATAGILWWASGWARALRRWAPAWLAEAIAIPLAAQLATQPLVTALNGQVSLVGLFANMVAEPFVGPVTVLGLIACLLSPLGPPAGLVGWLAGWCAQPIILAARAGAALPGATLAWGSAQWGYTLLALGVLTGVCWLLARLAPVVLARWWATAVTMALLIGAVAVPAPSPGWPGPWSVVFCDVGQGDAAVVRVSDGVGVLIDAGPDPPALSRCLADLHIGRLALVLFSHEHDDHMAGAAGLGGRVKIDLVLVRAGLPAPDQTGLPVFLGDSAIPVAATRTGQQITVGPVRWTTIRSGPLMQATATPATGEDPAPNNASTIGLLEVGGLRVLFTGDAETEEEALLAASGAGLTADVLKVAHHGSSRQDADFLAGTHAVVAVVSVGAGNDYGHPAARTMTTLQADGMRVYRTDQVGGVALIRSAQGITVHAQHALAR